MSRFGNKHYKPAHIFWTGLAVVLFLPLPIILFIFNGWFYALISFIISMIIYSASKTSAQKFVLQNMLESEDFWDYILLHKGATIKDGQGEEFISEFLSNRQEK